MLPLTPTDQGRTAPVVFNVVQEKRVWEQGAWRGWRDVAWRGLFSALFSCK